MNWVKCCKFEEGDIVKCDDKAWRAIRNTAKGERPGSSDAWVEVQMIRRAEAARMIDPRIGDGI